MLSYVNPLKAALRDGQKVLGTMIYHGSWAGIAELFATDGYQFVVLETEHSATDVNALDDLIRASLAQGIVPIVRPGQADYRLVAHAMDLGAMGVMVPRVNTVDQVRLVVDAVKYPPLGHRGCGGYRFDLASAPIAEQIRSLNAHTLVIIQVETVIALGNLNAMLDVAGVDAVVVGPLDLSISLEVPGEWHHERFVDAVQSVIDICRQHSVSAGIHTDDPERIRFWAERGMQVLMCSSDFGMLAHRSSEVVAELGQVSGLDLQPGGRRQETHA